MSGGSELAALQWLWRFCSPFSPAPPLPGEADWADIFRIADRHLVLPRLAIDMLPRRGEIGDAVADYLAATLELSNHRNDRLRHQLLTLCRAFNRAGIEPVLLKGAPLLLAREPAGYRRMMLDLDIWVPDGHQLDQAVRSLHDLGYRMHEDPATSSHTQHYPPFFHDGEIARVELHWDIVNTRLSELMDQKACAAASVPRESDGIRYRVLDERTALALSYLQCRLGVGAQKGYVTMMKWLDFLDRAHRLNIVAPRTRAELGLRGEWEQSDRQFLTALSDWADYPHGGERDDRFVRCWERSYREPFLIGYLKAMIGPAFRSERWKGKTAADLIRSVRYRLRTLPLLHERARSRDHFGS